MAPLDSISNYLVARIPEISYVLASVFMVFASDFIMDNFLLRRLRRMSFISRTCAFLAFGLLMLPGLTAGGALLLRDLVLNPYKEWIILTLVICFLLVGVFLSIKYDLKMKLKIM